MHNPHVRNWVIFSIVFLYVIVARDGLINALFSMWIGAWTMAKIFKYLFNAANDSENLTLDKFIPYPWMWFDLFSNKQTSLVIVWWSAGIMAALLTYYLLKMLLISS